MERIDEEGQVATAFTLATMLSAIPLAFYGPCKLLIFDIHALQERFYFGKKYLMRNNDDGDDDKSFPDHIPSVI
jgi:hypothetical protein